MAPADRGRAGRKLLADEELMALAVLVHRIDPDKVEHVVKDPDCSPADRSIPAKEIAKLGPCSSTKTRKSSVASSKSPDP